MKIRSLFISSLIAMMAVTVVGATPVYASFDTPVVVEEVYEDTYDTSQEEYTDEGTYSEEGAYSDTASDGIDSDSIGATLTDVMTVQPDELEKGAEFVAPLAGAIRMLISACIALLGVVIIANSIWDVVCISVRPLCQRILTGQTNSEDIMSKMASWASNEAVVAVQQANVGQSGGAGATAQQNHGGYSPYGNDGGYSPYGSMQTNNTNNSATPKAKQVLPIYFRKRAVFLVMFGVCVVLFCTTAFTDVGLEIGAWLANKISGIG